MEAGVAVWLKDLKGQESWVPASVTAKSEKDGKINITVRATDMDEERVYTLKDENEDMDEVKLQNSPSESEAENLINLPYLHEPAILHCLSLRYDRSEIYTYTGPILIAMNPFKKVTLYTTQILEKYYNRGLLVSQGIDNAAAGPLPPHVYAIADAAYRNMMTIVNNSRGSGGGAKATADQAILISGESGAGKTESTKIVLRYLTTVGNAKGGTDVDEGSVMDKVLQSNPILEAFGNSKTIRNDNSSRFGKFIELSFNRRGHLIGGSIDTYLLEKVRIPSQQVGERGFHIFYQICAGSSEEEKARWKLLPVTEFRYSNQGNVFQLRHVDDVQEFADMRRALRTLNFPEEDQMSVLDVIAAVMHMGQLEFQEEAGGSEEGSQLATSEAVQASLQAAVGLFKVSPEDLVHAFTTRTITTRGESYTKKLTHKQASDARDAVAKAIYGKIFDWLVTTINKSIAVENTKDLRAYIGVLDIFGFECFQFNSFEQLCINYTNETLQQQFNRFVFKFEQEEYTKEQISWSFISFPDNQDCLDLIEDKKMGLLAALDDECRGVSGNDTKYADNLYRTMASHDKFKERFSATKAQMAQKKFCIRHYAGPVIYSTGTFVEKNKDELPKETAALFEKSEVGLLKRLFTAAPAAAAAAPAASAAGGTPFTSPARSAAAQVPTVGTQFKSQLQQLMAKIETVKPHYIRCLKPNDQNVPDSFHRMRITEQLRYGGVLEAVRVARSGFPVRLIHADFYARYRPLANPFNPITSQLPRVIGGSADGGMSHSRSSNNALSKIADAVDETSKSSSKGRVSIHALSSDSSAAADPNSLMHCTDAKLLCETLLQALWDETVPEEEEAPAAAAGGVKKPQRRASRISEMALWRGKGSTAKESVQLGLSKVFLRKQAHDLLEARRSRRLVSAARKIQCHYRKHIIRKMYLNIRNAIYKLQRIMRGLLARRHAHHIRREHAAVVIQKYYRCFAAFVRFNDHVWAIQRLQSFYRGRGARKAYAVLREVFLTTRVQRMVRGLVARHKFAVKRARVIRLQCRYRMRRAVRELRSLKAQAKDLGKLQQNNEAMKAEIESLRKRAAEEAERIASEMKAKAEEEARVATAGMAAELDREKALTATLREELSSAQGRVAELEAEVEQLLKRPAVAAVASSGAVSALDVPQPPPRVKSNPGDVPVLDTGAGGSNASVAKVQAEYQQLLALHERETAMWTQKMAEMDELSTQLYSLSEANTRIEEENNELNEEVTRLRSLLLDQGSLGHTPAGTPSSSATSTPMAAGSAAVASAFSAVSGGSKALAKGVTSGGKALANIATGSMQRRSSAPVTTLRNSIGGSTSVGGGIVEVTPEGSAAAPGSARVRKSITSAGSTPLPPTVAVVDKRSNKSAASQLFRSASPSTLAKWSENFVNGEDEDDEDDEDDESVTSVSSPVQQPGRRGSGGPQHQRRPSTENEANAIGTFQKAVEGYKLKLKQGFNVLFWDGRKAPAGGATDKPHKLSRFDGTLRMQVDGQLSITKQQPSFKSLLGIGGASKSEIAPIAIADLVEVLSVNADMVKQYHLDRNEESLMVYVVSMCNALSVVEGSGGSNQAHKGSVATFERVTIMRASSVAERQVLYNTLRTIMVNGIAAAEAGVAAAAGSVVQKQRRLSARESVLLNKADQVKAAAEAAIAAALTEGDVTSLPATPRTTGDQPPTPGSAHHKHHRRGSTMAAAESSASVDGAATEQHANAAARRRSSVKESQGDLVKVQELQNQLMMEQANHHKLVVQVMTMSNELNEKDQLIIASKRREETLATILASKEKMFEQDASARVQLGQKMQALFIEKEEVLEQLDQYKEMYDTLKAKYEPEGEEAA